MSFINFVQIGLPPVVAILFGLFLAPSIDTRIGTPVKREMLAKVFTVLGAQVIALYISGVIAITINNNRYAEVQRQLVGLTTTIRTHADADGRAAAFYQASTMVARIEDRDDAAIFADGLAWQRDRAQEFASGRMYVERTRIFSTWERCLLAAKTSVRATNAVSADDWSGFSRDGKGILTQEKVLRAGRSIQRIMLYTRSSRPSTAGLAQLGAAHSAIGISVRYQDRAWLQRSEKYRDVLQKLGTDDLVLIDNRMLLLTHVDDQSGEMMYSYVTVDKDLVAIASAFFDELWDQSSTTRAVLP